jgi:hypothetical protein
MARSITQVATAGAATLIAETSMRAPRLPTVSMSQAVLSTSRRTCSIFTRASEIQLWTTPWSTIGRPKVDREAVRRQSISSARSAIPIARIAWWMRPGPSRSCASRNPSPSSPSRFAAGTRTSS